MLPLHVSFNEAWNASAGREAKPKPPPRNTKRTGLSAARVSVRQEIGGRGRCQEGIAWALQPGSILRSCPTVLAGQARS